MLGPDAMFSPHGCGHTMAGAGDPASDGLHGSGDPATPLNSVALMTATWNAAYPDRRPWSEIGEEAQAEWARVFSIYEHLKCHAH